MTGLGALQRRVLAHLHTPEPQAFMTAELAEALLGGHDREQVRRVRRAVDSLARLRLVTTWTGPASEVLTAPGDCYPRPTDVWIGTRRYVLPTRTRAYWLCAGDGCERCALGDEPESHRQWDPIAHDYFPVKIHRSYIVHQRLPRVRWVEFAWGARPVAERLALLGRWIDELREALTQPPHPILGDRRAEDAEQLATYEAEAEALRSAPPTGAGGPL